MLSIERQEKILTMLKEINQITIQELSEILSVSHNTVRADVSVLEQAGAIIKIHGGVTLPLSNMNAVNNMIGIRYSKNLNEKRHIAKEVVKHFPRDQEFSLFIDSSTSALEVANLLVNTDIRCTIITHFTNIVHALGTTTHISIILCGGKWWAYENCSIGDDTIEQLDKYHADIAIIGCTSLKMGQGIFNGNVETVSVKHKMIQNAEQTWLLCDSSKFDSSSLLKIADFHEINKIFTNKIPSSEWESYLLKNKVELHISE